MIDAIKLKVYRELEYKLYELKKEAARLTENAEVYISLYEKLEQPVLTFLSQLNIDYEYTRLCWEDVYRSARDLTPREQLKKEYDSKYEQCIIIADYLDKWAKKHQLKTSNDYFCEDVNVLITTFLLRAIQLNSKMPLKLFLGLNSKQKERKVKLWKTKQSKIQQLLNNFEIECSKHLTGLNQAHIAERKP